MSLDKEAFMSWVEPDANSCWIWLGSISVHGYGRYGKRKAPAHRIAFELFVGPIKQGYEVHHTCEVKRCVNPGHLVHITVQDHRRITHGWTKEGEVWYCNRGHEISGFNIKPSQEFIACRECHNMNQRKYYR